MASSVSVFRGGAFSVEVARFGEATEGCWTAFGGARFVRGPRRALGDISMGSFTNQMTP